jgi:CheY-like chemotaxis protein
MSASVLIVDDEFGLAELMAEVLADQGYDVSLAMNGQNALLCMAEKHVDLVLLDCMMPIMDGPTCLAKMRDDERFRSIPVIMMSAFERAQPPDHSGIQGFLLKPFSFAQLLSTVNPLLLQERSVAS